MCRKKSPGWVIGFVLIAVVFGCSDDKGLNGGRPENRIGPEGGTLQTPGGEVALAVPVGALQDDVDFTIEENDSPDPATGTMKFVSAVYSIGPAGTQFGSSVTITMDYDKSELGAASENSIVLCTNLNDGSGWDAMATAIDSTNNHATTQITHLSDFAVMVDTVPPAAVEVSGTIVSDTTWTRKDTIKVTGDVTVAATGGLTIQAGAIILFEAGTGLFIEGELTADGESGNRILFTSSADTAGGAPLAGEWNGVRFDENSGGVLRNCDLRYAVNCVYIYSSSPELDSCIIEGFSNAGIYVVGFLSSSTITPVIAHCAIGQKASNLLGTGIGIHVRYKADVTILGCTVRACSLGLEFYGQKTFRPHFQVTGCEICDHASRGVYTHSGG